MAARRCIPAAPTGTGGGLRGVGARTSGTLFSVAHARSRSTVFEPGRVTRVPGPTRVNGSLWAAQGGLALDDGAACVMVAGHMVPASIWLCRKNPAARRPASGTGCR